MLTMGQWGIVSVILAHSGQVLNLMLFGIYIKKKLFEIIVYKNMHNIILRGY